jgi:hypothetical protein
MVEDGGGVERRRSRGGVGAALELWPAALDRQRRGRLGCGCGEKEEKTVKS